MNGRSTLATCGERERERERERRERERERELNSVHAANRADGTQWIVHVRVSSILSRSCNKQEATSFCHGCHTRRRMAPWLSSKRCWKPRRMSSKAGHSKTQCLSSPTCMPGQRGQMRATRAMRSLLPISMGNAYAPSRKRSKRRMHLSLMGS